MTIRQEINIVDSAILGTGLNPQIVQLDTTQYVNPTYYFEIVSKNSSTSVNVTLQRVTGATNDATIAVTSASFVRQRVAFTPPAGQTNYGVAIGGAGTVTVNAARIIVIDNPTTFTSTETQIEIGGQGATTYTSTTAVAMTAPKYWLYTAANWDGVKTFFAEVTYKTASTNTATITIQQDDGAWNFSNLTTIVSAVSNTTATRTRVAFTPTDGRHYRISVLSSTTKSTVTIYNAKVVVDQRGGPTFDTSVGGGGNGVNSFNFAALTTGGTNRLLIAVMMYSNSTPSGVTFSGGSGLTWHQLATRVANAGSSTNGFTDIYYSFASATQTAQTITATLTGGGFPQTAGIITAYTNTDTSGVDGAGAIGASQSGSGSGANPSVSVTTTRASSIVLGLYGQAGNVTYTAGSGFSLDAQQSGGSTVARVGSEHSFNSYASGTSVAAPITASAANWGGFAVEIKAPTTVANVPTLYEAQYLLLNTISTTTGVQSYQSLWDENLSGITLQPTLNGDGFAGVTNTYKHAVEGSGAEIAEIDDIDNSNTVVTGSNETITAAQQTITSALTMPANTSHQLDTNYKTKVTALWGSRMLVAVNTATPAHVISDSTTITEDITVTVAAGSSALSLSVFDSTTITENVKMLLINNISVNDATTPSENVVPDLINLININETAVATDIRTNYIVNPSFETNDLFWATGGGTKAQDSTTAYIGNDSLLFTGSLVDDKVYAQISDGLATALIGKQYTFSAYLKGSGTIKIWVYDGSVDQYSSDIVLTSTWTRYSFTVTCQSASSMLAGLRIRTANSVSCNMDAVLFEQNASALSYFDGSFINGVWTGTANNSTSQTALVTVSEVSSISVNDAVTTYENWLVIPPITVSDPKAFATIHVGSQALDVHTNSQADTDAVILAITTNIPNADYIAISTYLDYTVQISRWATSIHNAGKKMWLRSAGYNDWQGTNGVTQYTSADFAAHSTAQYVSFVNSNSSIFQSGDIFEPIPDEPENNSMWNTTYGTIGSGAGQTAYNAFFTSSISQIATALTNNSVTGVTSNIVNTNPSASRDVITSATAGVLRTMATDDFPEGSDATSALMQADMQNELNTWIVGQQNNKPYEMTIGPNVNVQLSQAVQADTYVRYFKIIQNSLRPLYGLTVWQFGATDNGPNGRIFDYTGGNWVARDCCAVINSYFATLKGTISVLENVNLTVVDLISVNDATTTTENVRVVPTIGNISVNDASNVTESVTVDVIPQINVNDPTTVTESVLLYYPPQVSDSSTITEFVAISITSQINVFDATTTSESISRTTEENLTVSDSSTVTDVLQYYQDTVLTSEVTTLDLIDTINKNDATTVTENISISLSADIISVFDATTTSESVVMLLTDFINVNDATTTSESVTVNAVPQINVSDSSTVSESVTLDLIDGVIVNDSSNISESVVVNLIGTISVFDSSTASENVVMDLFDMPVVFDSSTVTENIQISMSSDIISVNDPVSATEAIFVTLVDGEIIVDAVITSENITISIINFISVNDASSTSESVTVDIVLQINVNDASTITENIKINEEDDLIVSDSSTVTENIQISLSADIISVFDSSTTSENIVVDEIDLINVFDSTTTSEFVSLSSVVNDENINVFDSTSISENVVVDEIDLISVFDATTASESVTVYDDENINVFDSSTITENVKINLIGGINVFDASTITENVVLDAFEMPSVFDSVSTSENIAIIVSPYSISVNDVTTATEAVFVTLIDGEIIVDAVITSENVQMLLADFISVNDASTASESVATDLFDMPVVSDSSSTSESVTLNEIDNIFVFDSTTTSETVSLTFALAFSVSDSVTASENITIDLIDNPFVFDASTVSENVSISVSALIISVNDASTISEFVSIDLIDTISVFDTTTTSEFVALDLIETEIIFDAVTTSESVTLLLTDFISVSDSSTISENIVFSISGATNLISVNDTVTTSESVVVIQSIGNISVNDSSTTSENIVVNAIDGISVNDASTTSENTATNITDNPFVFDSSSISESITIRLSNFISVSDSSVTSEFVALSFTEQISVTDQVSTTENITLNASEEVSASDSTSTSESVLAAVANTLSVSDTASTSESVTVHTNISISVNDSTTVSEFIVVSAFIGIVITVFDSVAVSDVLVKLTSLMIIHRPHGASIKSFLQELQYTW